jgi:hypothetical protein
MITKTTIALAAGFSLAMFGFAGTAAADNHHHHNNHHNNNHHNHNHHHGHHQFDEGFGFGFEVPDVYIDLSNSDDAHASWCYKHKPNYDEDSDMYYSHGSWKPCVAPFD